METLCAGPQVLGQKEKSQIHRPMAQELFFLDIFRVWGKIPVLAAWPVVFAAVSLAANFYFWDRLSIVGKDGFSSERSIVDVVYYTATIPIWVGELTPESDFGRWLFSTETGIGLVLVTFFVTLVVRKAFR